MVIGKENQVEKNIKNEVETGVYIGICRVEKLATAKAFPIIRIRDTLTTHVAEKFCT